MAPEKHKHKNDEKEDKIRKNWTSEYLGSDGVKILTAHNIYLNECLKFRAKAKKYKYDNEYIRNSFLLYDKPGYEGNEEIETEVLQEREKQWNQFYEIFDFKSFDTDKEAMYKCLKGKSKRIRIIRKIQQPRNMNFSENSDKHTNCWFLRYGSLSRFIQAGRKIIIINRLKKVLMRIRSSEIIRELKEENEVRKQKEIEEMNKQLENAKIGPCFKAPQKCCNS